MYITGVDGPNIFPLNCSTGHSVHLTVSRLAKIGDSHSHTSTHLVFIVFLASYELFPFAGTLHHYYCFLTNLRLFREVMLAPPPNFTLLVICKSVFSLQSTYAACVGDGITPLFQHSFIPRPCKHNWLVMGLEPLLVIIYVSLPPQPMPQLLPEAEGRQVGVVKPYAIFKIPEELQRKNSESSLLQNSVVSPPRSRLATVSLSEEPRLVQHSMIGPPRSRLATVSLSEEPRLVQHSMIGPPRSRLATVSLSEAPVHHRQQSGGTELLERRGRSASVTTPLRLSKQPIIPKRKAPPPPSRPPAKPRHSLKPKGCTKTTTQLPSPHPVHKNSTVAQQVPGHRARARTVVGNETTATLRKKKIPPQKPPRTLSTFITSAEQEALLQQLLAPQQPSGTKQQLLAHQQPPGTKHQLLAPQQPPGTKQQPSQHRRSYSEYAHLSEPQHQQHGRRSRLSLPQLPYHFSSEPAVIQQCIAVAYHSQNSAGHPGSEFTASAGHSGSSSRSSDSSPPPPSVFVSPGQLHSEISLLMMATLHAVSEGGTWGKVCREQLWECQWQDFQILSPNLVSHNGIPLSLEVRSAHITRHLVLT